MDYFSKCIELKSHYAIKVETISNLIESLYLDSDILYYLHTVLISREELNKLLNGLVLHQLGIYAIVKYR
jgi:hypothetical protein